jgi:NAD(P)-dependent dehydrogenase (short-subunit alcohol dehydrogenase family)
MATAKLTWLITGCSSGFGLSLARAVLAGGHKVIATSRNPSRTPVLVAEIESKGGKWVQLDVNSSDSGTVIDELERGGDRIDVLVNNAGYCVYAPIETATEAEVKAQMETMFFGPLRLIQAVLPYMRQRKAGVIVNMSSGASLDGINTMGVYAGAKAGLDGKFPSIADHPVTRLIKYDAIALTKILAKEVAPFNIRTLTVVLGTFNTNMPNSIVLGETPLPEDYRGTFTEQVQELLVGGKVKPNGDKDKAMKAVFEVVAGVGVGEGHQSEKLLPLGSDMTPRLKGVQEYLGHALDVFGSVTNSVDVDEK